MSTPTIADLLWGTPQRPKRGPKPSLSLDRIIETAVAMADAEGLANLTMQRLAERLGYTKMSLYRYVPGKAELTALMLDAGIGSPPELAAAATGPVGAHLTGPVDPHLTGPVDAHGRDQPWRVQLRAWAIAILHAYRSHPWSIELSVGARLFGPNELDWLETALRALAATALTGPERLDAVVLLNGHVRNLVQQTMTAASPEAVEREITGPIRAILLDHGDRFPEVRAAFTTPRAPKDEDNALEFGIDRILDGIAVLIAERGKAVGRSAP